jgi:hypothetical protein
MAQDNTPAAWIPGWATLGTTISFPAPSIPELDLAEADADTGDIRKVIFALLEKIYDHYAGLPSADQPSNLTFGTSGYFNNQNGALERTYSLKFTLAATSFDVA